MTGNYKAFLLRFQRGGGQDRWRVTLVDALGGGERYFTTERDLFRYLMQTLAEESLPMDANEETSHGVETNDEDRSRQD